MADAATPLSIDLAVFEARRLLQKPVKKPVSALRGLGAAALAAFCAFLLAGAVILGPGGVGGSQTDQALSHWQP